MKSTTILGEHCYMNNQSNENYQNCNFMSICLKISLFPNEYRGNTVNSMRIKDVLMLNIAVL